MVPQAVALVKRQPGMHLFYPFLKGSPTLFLPGRREKSRGCGRWHWRDDRKASGLRQGRPREALGTQTETQGFSHMAGVHGLPRTGGLSDRQDSGGSRVKTDGREDGGTRGGSTTCWRGCQKQV